MQLEISRKCKGCREPSSHSFPDFMIQKGWTHMTWYHFSYIVSTLVSSKNAKEYVTFKPINSNKRKLGSCHRLFLKNLAAISKHYADKRRKESSKTKVTTSLNSTYIALDEGKKNHSNLKDIDQLPSLYVKFIQKSKCLWIGSYRWQLMLLDFQNWNVPWDKKKP